MSNITKKTAIDELEQESSRPIWTWRRLLAMVVVAVCMFVISYGMYIEHPLTVVTFLSLVIGAAVVMIVNSICAYNRILDTIKPLYIQADLYRRRWKELEVANRELHARRVEDGDEHE